MKKRMKTAGIVSLALAIMLSIAACGEAGDPTSPPGPGENEPKDVNLISVQEELKEAETHQESASLAEFISANYDPDLKYIILTRREKVRDCRVC